MPLPATEIEYSGSLSLQIPKSLHLSLAEKAEREGVSLDQYILVVLSKAG
ncbi:MAG: toxin-antitoxin system HicB family antitoxin [Microcoleus sp.]